MKKLTVAIIVALVGLLFGFVSSSQAALLVVDEDGNLVWQVLSKASDENVATTPTPKPQEDEQDEDKEEVKEEVRVEVRTTNRGSGKVTGEEVRIRTENGRIKLRVASPSGETEMDVTGLKGDIVRVRERTEEKEIRIRSRAGRLEIRQKGVGALTNFPVSVNPQTNELTITTPAGTRVVAVLPAVAVQNILASGVMDRILAPKEEATGAAELEEEEEGEVEFTGVIESVGPRWVVGGRTVVITPSTVLDEGLVAGVLAEVEGTLQPDGTVLAKELETREEVSVVEEDGQVAFEARGVKDVRFLNLFPVSAPVGAIVSAQTGKTLSVSRPWFLNFFGFLFAQ